MILDKHLFTFSDDVSSISGSDNEEEDVETLGFQLHRQAKILFENSKGQVISMFRCLLYDKKVSSFLCFNKTDFILNFLLKNKNKII